MNFQMLEEKMYTKYNSVNLMLNTLDYINWFEKENEESIGKTPKCVG